MAQDSPWESYTQATILNKRIVPDYISLIDPIDTPFINWLGLDSARGKFRFQNPSDGRQVEWLMDQYRQLTGSMSVSVASDATALTVSDATNYKIGDVLILSDGSEYANVTAVNATTNVLTIVRAFGGTTAATQQTGTISILTVARIEGADADQGPLEVVTSAYNVTQILEDSRKATGTAQAIDQYGMADPLEYQRQKVLPEQWRFLERVMLISAGRAGGSKTAARLMGGLPYFIATNTTTAARSALAITDFQSVVYSIHLAGGMVDMMVIHPYTLNTLTNLYNTSAYLRVTQDEDKVGMNISRVVTPFATFDALASKWCGLNDIWFIDQRHIGGYTLRPFMERVLPSDGDYMQFEFVGEFSMCLKHEDAFGYIQLS